MLNFFNQPSASFAEPIEMLYACHGKVKRFCDQINRLPDYLAKHGYNDTVRQAIQQIRHYFNTAAPLHHEDEEHDFFPLLMRYAPETQSTILFLESQHQSLHDLWIAVSDSFAAIEANSPYQPEVLSAFTTAYEEHIVKEEPLFEIGQQSIPEVELTAIGKIMAARRQN